jgi:two-component system response regulator YesN
MTGAEYSFVVVDDEPEIREGIRDSIPWEELGFSFAGACANGFEALELAERIQPDAVLTDINMPFLDGLTFTDRLAVVSPSTKVLIISGYDDFEYARKAVRLQVYDYIVKPVTPVEFKAVLVKLKATLDRERAERLNMEHIKRQLAESIPLLRERFLVKLIEGKLIREVIRERLDYFDLALPCSGSAYQCLTLDFVHRREGADFDMDLLSHRNILEHSLEFRNAAARTTGLLFQDREDRLILLIWGADTVRLYREGLKLAELLCRNLLSLGFKDSIAGVGEPVEDLEALPVSYNQAVDALSASAFRGRSGVAVYREVTGKTGAPKPEPDPRWDTRIASALKTGEREEACRLIGEMMRYFQNTPFTIEEYHIKLSLVLAAFMRCCEDLAIPEAEVFPPGFDPFAALPAQSSGLISVQGPGSPSPLTNLDAVRLWFITIAERIGEFTQARQENFAQVKVREALDYLQSNYADPALSLQSLCKKVYISMSYFSAILKKYHNKTFVEELTDIRLNKAMELLRTTDMMTYEIAEKVGYRDAHYFSLSFRKYAGLTATEYRNRSRHAGQ